MDAMEKYILFLGGLTALTWLSGEAVKYIDYRLCPEPDDYELSEKQRRAFEQLDVPFDFISDSYKFFRERYIPW